MNVIDLKDHRAWIKNLNSHQTHTAWLGDFDGQRISMEIVGAHEIQVGEKWICSVNRTNASNQFLMCIDSVDSKFVDATLVSAMHQSESKGHARLRSGFMTQVRLTEGDIEGRVVDVAAAGMGMVCPSPIEVGTIVECVAQVGDDATTEINLKGKIVHCAPIADGTAGYRLGLSFEKLNRLDTARWLVYISAGEPILMQTRRVA